MSEIKTVLQSELDTIKTLQQAGAALARRFGDLSVQALVTKMALAEIETAIAQLETQRRQFTAEIEQKYGAGTINIETGEFTPSAQ